MLSGPASSSGGPVADRSPSAATGLLRRAGLLGRRGVSGRRPGRRRSGRARCGRLDARARRDGARARRRRPRLDAARGGTPLTSTGNRVGTHRRRLWCRLRRRFSRLCRRGAQGKRQREDRRPETEPGRMGQQTVSPRSSQAAERGARPSQNPPVCRQMLQVRQYPRFAGCQ